MASESGAGARPNIVVIVADDMAFDDCGAFGHRRIRTPNLDRLAREGMRFEQAYVTASSCSPSRCSMMTGRYPHNTGAEGLHDPLPGDQVTFTDGLREAGYWVGAAGKWHLGGALQPRFDLLMIQPKQVGVGGNEAFVPLLRARPKDRPFFAWLASMDPHRPYAPGAIAEPHRPEDVVVPPYLPDVPEVRADLALYYDEIGRLDEAVGRVMAELEAQGVADNTMVLFVSDNGRPFPRCKTTCYTDGLRTPFVVRWPGRVAPGSVCRQLVSTVDMAPTFAEAAGAKPSPTFHGRSFLPLLRGEDAPIREFIYGEHNWHDYSARERCVRSREWLYIRNSYSDLPATPPADAVSSITYQAMRRLRDEGKLNADQMQIFRAPQPAEALYRLGAADPHDLRNVADDSANRAVLERMRAEMARWQKETDDREPPERRPDRFDRETGKRLTG